MMRTSMLLFILAAILTTGASLSGCARSSAAGSSARGELAREKQAVEVSVAEAGRREVQDSLEATGSIVAVQSANIASEASGIVDSIPINDGDFVAQGATIARLSDRDARLRLEQALAAEQQATAVLNQALNRLGLTEQGKFDASQVPEVQEAQAALESAESSARLADTNARRYEKLLGTGDTSRLVYDQARNQAETARAAVNAARHRLNATMNAARQGHHEVDAARAAVANARSQAALARKGLGDTVIRAPFSGHISARLVNKGEYVSPSTALATIVRPDPLKLMLQLSETEAARVKIGLAVTAHVDAYPDRTFTGKIVAINPQVDPQARAIMLEAIVANPENLIHPGMFARASIGLAGTQTRVYVPRSAVFMNPAINSPCIYVVDGERVRLKVVQTGAEEKDEIQITSGVEPGEKVVTSGPDQLFDGAAVKTGTR